MHKRIKAILSLGLTILLTGICGIVFAAEPNSPMEQRTGETSIVYFTRDISSEGLIKLYQQINKGITGKVAIKLHTGEKNGPNIIPRQMVWDLQKTIPSSSIVETNTYYKLNRYTTAEHRDTLKTNGWDFCPVDIIDEEGAVMLPVKGGKHFTEMSMGKNLLNYDSMLVLTHFKGHTMGGFGGSMKNIAIGCADAHVGKAMIHTGDDRSKWGSTTEQWGISKEPFMERMAESAKAVTDHFGKHIVFINVLRNMSVDCDCAGLGAAPVVTPDIGILASTDLLAIDQASVDMVYALPEHDNHDLIERIESRKGLRQLSYMKELKMGNDKYQLVDMDK